MNKKYIIFDFDGTIMNTNAVIIDSWNATGEHFLGHSFDLETIERSYGETIVYTSSYLFPGYDPKEIHRWYGEYQEAHCSGLVSLFDGVRELLDELISRGYTLALASSRTRWSYSGYAESFDLDKYFDVTITKEDVATNKPDPAAVLLALEKLGASPEEAIMIGDTRFDIGCANNAGVDSVLVTWAHSIDMEQMAELGFKPSYTINTPAELLDIV